MFWNPSHQRLAFHTPVLDRQEDHLSHSRKRCSDKSEMSRVRPEIEMVSTLNKYSPSAYHSLIANGRLGHFLVTTVTMQV